MTAVLAGGETVTGPVPADAGAADGAEPTTTTTVADVSPATIASIDAPIDAPDIRLEIAGTDRDTEFAAFMTEAAPVLGRTAWLLCGDVHRAEELVQQTLVRTYVAWPRARENDPLAYSRRVLANLRIDSWRKHRRETLTAPEDLPEGYAASDADQHANRDLLVRALMKLSPQRRRVVVLRYLMDLSENAVADDLSISVGTVKSTASRGLEQLRALLGPDWTHDASRTTPARAKRES